MTIKKQPYEFLSREKTEGMIRTVYRYKGGFFIRWGKMRDGREKKFWTFRSGVGVQFDTFRAARYWYDHGVRYD